MSEKRVDDEKIYLQGLKETVFSAFVAMGNLVTDLR